MNIKLNKIDAVKQQLCTAIFLFFNDIDPVSAHTLTAASYSCLKTLNRLNKGSPMGKEVLIGELIKEHGFSSKKAFQLVNEADNFFKHADKDHDSELLFDPEYTIVLLFEACITYLQITHDILNKHIKAFITWHLFKYPEVESRLPQDMQLPIELKAAFSKMSKLEFYRSVS